MKFDLHLHTTYSDGRLSPTEIVDLAFKKGLSGIAITDHDTIAGVEEAIKQSKNYNNFKVIPGIEFSTIYENEEVHILGYFIDYKNKELIKTSEDLIDSRYIRAEKIIDKLNNLGYNINIDDVLSLSKDKFIGRPHIARVLINKGYFHKIQEVFNILLNSGKPAYVERYRMSVSEAINIIKSNKGFSILAHPGLLKNKRIIDHCISMGIDGIECIHSKHSDHEINSFAKIANENNLIITGGSDCHGDTNSGSLLLGKYFTDINTIPKFKEMI